MEERDKLELKLEVSSDAMQVMLHSIAGRDPTSRVSGAELVKALNDAGIHRGIRAREIEAAVKGRTIGDFRPMVVANGLSPVNPRPARLERLFKRFEIPIAAENGETSLPTGYGYSVVAEELVARLWKERPGTDGFNVLGDLLPAEKPEGRLDVKTSGVIEAVEGESCIEYRASKNGVVSNWRDDLIEVREELIIEKDVEPRTGNIDCLWPIVIANDVAEGFSVRGNSTIRILGAVRAGSQVIARGAVNIAGGVVGEKTIVSSSSGDVEAGHVEYATIEAHGDIVVRSHVIGGTLRAGGKIRVLGAGLTEASDTAVRGGTLNAVGGIVVASAGSKLAARTVLAAGFDLRTFQAQLKLRSARKQIQDDDLRLRRSVDQILCGKDLAAAIDGLPPHKKRHLVGLLRAITSRHAQIRKIDEKIGELDQSSMGHDDRASVRIIGTGYPDLTIRLGRYANLEEHESVSGVTYALDGGKSRILRT